MSEFRYDGMSWRAEKVPIVRVKLRNTGPDWLFFMGQRFVLFTFGITALGLVLCFPHICIYIQACISYCWVSDHTLNRCVIVPCSINSLSVSLCTNSSQSDCCMYSVFSTWFESSKGARGISTPTKGTASSTYCLQRRETALWPSLTTTRILGRTHTRQGRLYQKDGSL